MRLLLFISLCLIGIHKSIGQDYFDDLNGNGNPVLMNLYKDWNVSARFNVGTDNSLKLNFFQIYRVTLRDANGPVSSNIRTYLNSTASDPLPSGLIAPIPAGGTVNCDQCFAQHSYYTIRESIRQPKLYLANPTNGQIPEEDFSCSVCFTPQKTTFTLNDLGWGLSMKAKTDNGLGELFTKGKGAPNYQFGLYGVLKRVKVVADVHKYTFVVSPFANFNFAAYRLYNPDTVFTKQLRDTLAKGFDFGVSAFVKLYVKNDNQIIVGGSVTASKLSNYKKLDKVEIKNTHIDTSGGVTRYATNIDDDGYTYAKGDFKQYWNVNVKVYTTIIPKKMDYRAAFIIYPSMDFNKLYNKPFYNFGFGIQFLEKNNPTLSIAGVFIELTDVKNNKESKEPSFLKRSIKIGITSALNVVSLLKK